jgi:ERCC4-type nuclease
MLYYDPTEGRANLDQKIKDFGIPLIGLEAATGADILISPMPTKIPGGNINRPPGSFLFPQHVKNGMLIQRKAGFDLINSIMHPRLNSILVRMQKWEQTTHWLLTIGIFDKSSDYVRIDKRISKFGWTAMKGAIDAWQLAGGLHHHEDDEEEGGKWLLRWNEGIANLKDSEYFVRPAHNLIHLREDTRPWRATLESFPGVGSVLSTVIADHCGDLKTALWWMTDERETGLAGIGQGMKKRWRAWLELNEDEILLVVDREDALAKPQQTKEMA